jgi:5-oxoprolinase (ATP-hydrolysing)
MPPDSRHGRRGGRADRQLPAGRGGALSARRRRARCWPARVSGAQPEQNLADLQAQIAANEKGVRGAARMVEHFGLDVVHAYMRHVQDNAEESVRRVIDALRTALRAARWTTARDHPRGDHGRPRGAQRDDRLHRHLAAAPEQLQRPSAVCMAAVLYVFRTLVDDDIPLNAGCLKPLEIVIPEGSHAQPALPGGGGRRQRRDLAVHHRRALRRARRDGASQGTMNNFTFGNERHQYYETVCGGSGAGGPASTARRRGADAHDQLAPHRPRGARVALPGALEELRDPPRLGRRGPLARRRRRVRACASSSR